ncbi:MAG: hypothetical protein NT027_07355 [Proteobacteria bacterium]|nr:hypothetical protein [Pseudomonadota bacterium]
MKLGMTHKLMLAVGLLTAACNNNDNSGLRVAGGEIDGTGSSAKYPGTVYVEMKSEDFNGVVRIIRNVGTIVDVGHGSKYGLILSLADTMVDMNGMQVLPMFKAVQINLHFSDKTGIPFPLEPMQLDVEGKKGLFKTKDGQAYPVIAVGLKAQQVASSKIPQGEVDNIGNAMFLEAPLDSGIGNLRIQNTSYMMIGIPKSVFADIPSAQNFRKIVPAGPSKKENLVMVGFGETKYKAPDAQLAKSLALSSEVKDVVRRNFSKVSVLNGTPLSQVKGYDKISSEIWEVKESGLCGSSDGQNYDTGASIYQDDQLVGFAVRSTAISANYRGRLDCSVKDRADMATLVISPTAAAIAKFKAALDQN